MSIISQAILILHIKLSQTLNQTPNTKRDSLMSELQNKIHPTISKIPYLLQIQSEF